MEEILGSIYCNNSEKFGTKLMKDVFKTLKAEKHDLGVVMKEKKIGNLYGFSGGNYAGNVYEKNNLCPTINTCQGGGKQPMIVEKANATRMVRTEEGKKLRKQYENHEIHHGFNEFKEPELRKDGCSNTLTSVQKDNMVCVAMRGRNPENPSDRTPGVHTEQRLEVNQNGTSNTLTSVQKDNLVMETVKIKQATKEGYIKCEVGGGCRSVLPKQ